MLLHHREYLIMLLRDTPVLLHVGTDSNGVSDYEKRVHVVASCCSSQRKEQKSKGLEEGKETSNYL